VLPESVTTGFTPGLGAEELWDLVSPVPGPVTEPLQEAARRLGVHVVVGTYERGGERGVVHNAAVHLDRRGEVAGVYRKTHPFCTEMRSRGGWVTPGDEVCVVETDLGRIGMIICFDGDYPELSRITAVRGAEVIVRPSALLRSADIWELTNRARAYDNHVYVVGANATGSDPAGVLYFGNSMIVTPVAEVVARASSHECWVSARLDPATAMASLTPGSSVPQVFDHLADRNLNLIRRYADDLTRPAETSFPHKAPDDEIVD
jgi:deaminated glutathione amidase